MAFTKMYAGDSKIITVNLTDEQGAALDVSGAEFVWRLGDVITKSTSDGGVTVADASQGAITIKLEPADTENIAGLFDYNLKSTDQQGNESTLLTGRVRIE